MAEPLTPQQLLDALRKWNVDYELYPNWEIRESGGDSNPIGFMIHHTGGPFTESDSYLDFLFNRGRPGIPGPLCNLSIGPSGTVYVGSLENANHAGRGDWTTRVLVGDESYDGYNDEIDPGPDDYGTGNELFWGVEINYPGTLPMRTAQYQSAIRLSAALMDAFGESSGVMWSALSVIGHREHSLRKWDPGQTPMDKFRRDVRDLLAAGPQSGVGESGMSWNEDLSPGTPGNDITGYADGILPGNWGRHAADLLGYAAAAGHIIINGEKLAQRIWRQDHVIPSPQRYSGHGGNPHWYGSRYLEEIWTMLYELQQVPDRLEALEAAVHGSNQNEIKELINQRHNEAEQQRENLADNMLSRLDAIEIAVQGSDPAEAKLSAILEILGVSENTTD